VDPAAEEKRAKEEHGPYDTSVEEERGAGVIEEQGAGAEAHVEDAEEGVWWRADAEEGARWRANVEEERAPTGVKK
jgi:hypothetical protein